MPRTDAPRLASRDDAARLDADPTSGAVRWLALAVLILIGLSAYANAFHGEFVFDDIGGVRNKPLLRNPANYLSRWDGYHAHPGRWFGYLTFALNHWAGGLNTFGFHALNIAIHLVAAMLVHELVRLTFETPRLRGSGLRSYAPALAFVTAALFLTHPLQTQAVTYIVQRFTSLASALYLAAVVLYARWRLRREAGATNAAAGTLAWGGILAATLLAMKTKEIALTLPAAASLYEVTFFRGPWRRRILYLAPVLITLPVIPLAMIDLGQPVTQVLAEATQAARVQTTLSRADYLATELPVLVAYLRLLIWPAGQSVDHDVAIQHSFMSPAVIGSGLVLALLAALAVWLAWRATRRDPRAIDAAALLAAFGIAWFFLTISIESSVIPIVDPMFEHRMYLPSAGLFAAFAVGGAALARRLVPRRPQRALTGVGLALAATLAAVTFSRNRVWSDEVTLWTDAVEKAPAKARPRQNLGVALVTSGRLPEAVEQFRTAVQLDPGSAESNANLGAALIDLGRRADAIASLEAALRIQPDHADASYNLGRIALDEGQLDSAEHLLRRALQSRPDFPQAAATLAGGLNRQGRFAEAIALIHGGGSDLAALPEARFNLGVALASSGELEAALAEARTLARSSPSLSAQLTKYIESRSR